MTFELWCLLAATGLGLVHLSADSFSFKAQVGNAYTVGPRDEEVHRAGVAGRLQRATRNFLESFPLFAVVVILVFITHHAGALSKWGCLFYVVGRVLYLPLYAAGVPWVRTFSWNLATLGLVLVGAQLFF